MSAFVVTDQTIAGMLKITAPRYPGDGATYAWNDELHFMNGNKEEIAQRLIDENYRSVNARYDEQIEPHKFTNPVVRWLEPVEILKLCNCYEYQSCETEDWEQTEAYAILTALRARAINSLPGYEEAAWDLHEPVTSRRTR